MEQLKSTITVLIDKLIDILRLDKLRTTVNKHIKINYDSGLEDMELKLNMNFSRDKDKLNLIKNFTFDNIKGMTDEIREKLRKELTQAFINNESMTKMKDRIKGIMDIAENRAIMIARTESLRAEEIGRYDAATQSGLKLKKYLLVKEDSRTSPICKAMNSKYGSPDKAINIDRKFKVVVNGKEIEGLTSPFHPNCRTITQYIQSD